MMIRLVIQITRGLLKPGSIHTKTGVYYNQTNNQWFDYPHLFGWLSEPNRYKPLYRTVIL